MASSNSMPRGTLNQSKKDNTRSFYSDELSRNTDNPDLSGVASSTSTMQNRWGNQNHATTYSSIPKIDTVTIPQSTMNHANPSWTNAGRSNLFANHSQEMASMVKRNNLRNKM